MAVFFAAASVARASVWWGEVPEGSNRLTEALGNAELSHFVRPLKRADLSDVAFAAESSASSSDGVVGAVVYRGPRLGASIGLAHRSLGVSAVHPWWNYRAFREPRPTNDARHTAVTSSRLVPSDLFSPWPVARATFCRGRTLGKARAGVGRYRVACW